MRRGCLTFPCFQNLTHTLPDAEPETDQLDQMTAVQLKALCKEQGLKISGKKSELQDRLREHFLTTSQPEQPTDDFDTMSDDDLRDALKARNLAQDGNKEEMLERLREDVEMMRTLQTAVPPSGANGFATITEALEAQAKQGGAIGDILEELKVKSSTLSKHMDVTITSLGMQATKFTAGGAPSVTAAVLRELAGEPFEDPPKYGTVCTRQP